jgi:hypothetical protein
MTPEEVVRAVFDRVHASDPTVSDLYAENAMRVAHDGRQDGRAAIARFYERRFPMQPPFPEIDGVFANPPFVAVLLRLPESNGQESNGPERDGTRPRVLDLFEVEAGEIRSLHVLLETPGTR